MLIDKLERYMEYRYQDAKLQFVVDDTQQTPIANSKQKLQSDTPISGLGASNDDLEIENDRVQEELSFWKYIVSKNTISGYTEYVAKYPKGMYIKTANEKILEILDNQEIEFWSAISEKDRISGYEEYLEQYPNGQYVQMVKDRIAYLRQRESQEQSRHNSSSNTNKVYKKPYKQSQNNENERGVFGKKYSKVLAMWTLLFSLGGLAILGKNLLPEDTIPFFVNKTPVLDKLPIAAGKDITKATNSDEMANEDEYISTPNIFDELENSLVDYSQFKLIRTINVSSSSVQDLDFSPDNQYIVTASDGIGSDYHGQTPTLSNMIFRVDTGEKVKEFEGGNTEVVYAPNSKIIATASSDESMIDNKISIYSIKKDDVISEYPSESYLSNLGFSANGNYLAYGDDNSVVVKNTLSDENITISDLGHLFSFVGEDYPNMIAVVGSDINIIDLNTKKVIFNVPAYYDDGPAWAEAEATPSIIRFAISPNGRVVATVDSKNTLRVGKIDFINGSGTAYDVIKSDYPDELILGDLIFTPNGLHLIHKNHKSLDVYRVSDMKKTASISIPENTWSVDISSDGKYIAVGTGHPKGQVLIYGVK